VALALALAEVAPGTKVDFSLWLVSLDGEVADERLLPPAPAGPA